MRRSPTQMAAERERLAAIEKADLDDVRQLMKQPAFRRYLRRYLELTSVFQTTFTGSSETFFKEGKRAVGTTMLGEIMTATPDSFMAMMQERTNAERFPPAVDPDD